MASDELRGRGPDVVWMIIGLGVGGRRFLNAFTQLMVSYSSVSISIDDLAFAHNATQAGISDDGEPDDQFSVKLGIPGKRILIAFLDERHEFTNLRPDVVFIERRRFFRR